MSTYLPAGRLSKVEEDGVVIQIQTEFSWRPQPRVATSVCLDGVILHKIQRDWEAPVESEPQQRAVENFISRQHDEVVSIIEDQKSELIRTKRPVGVSAILSELIALKGINAAWCLTAKGIISLDSGGRELLPEYRAVFEGLVSLCSFLSTVQSIGDMIDGKIVLQEDSLLIVNKDERHFIVGYDQGEKPAELLARVGKVLEQI